MIRPDLRVYSLQDAFAAYWSATNSREDQAAYHEILLFGGADGFSDGGIRPWISRQLRRLACWVDR